MGQSTCPSWDSGDVMNNQDWMSRMVEVRFLYETVQLVQGEKDSWIPKLNKWKNSILTSVLEMASNCMKPVPSVLGETLTL